MTPFKLHILSEGIDGWGAKLLVWASLVVECCVCVVWAVKLVYGCMGAWVRGHVKGECVCGHAGGSAFLGIFLGEGG